MSFFLFINYIPKYCVCRPLDPLLSMSPHFRVFPRAARAARTGPSLTVSGGLIPPSFPLFFQCRSTEVKGQRVTPWRLWFVLSFNWGRRC